MHTYEIIKNNPIYSGMPEFTESFHPYCEDFPLECHLLLKITTIPMYNVIYGKTLGDDGYINQDFRHYAFNLYSSVKDGWGIMNMYIKGENNFFKHQKEYKIISNYQIIPMTYKTMSKMTSEEILIIYRDFD